MYKAGDMTHYSQLIPDDNIGRCFTEVIKQSSYEARKKLVDEFNRYVRYFDISFQQPIKYILKYDRGRQWSYSFFE